MNPFTLSRGELCALLRVACRDETRLHLAGVHFDWDRGKVSATDGYMMLQFTPGKPGGAGEQLVERDVLRRLARVMTAESELKVELGEKVTLTVHDGPYGTAEVRCVVARNTINAPPYEQIIPAAARTVTPRIAFSTRFASRLKAVSQCLDRHGNTGCTMHVPAGELDPIKFTFECDTRWVAVLMPMKGWNSSERSAAE